MFLRSGKIYAKSSDYSIFFEPNIFNPVGNLFYSPIDASWNCGSPARSRTLGKNAHNPENMLSYNALRCSN